MLDAVSFPAQRAIGALVDFQVAPRDALSPIAGAAEWDFGDGFASGNKVSHIFPTPGTYTITVKASDTLGNTTVIANRSIRIVTAPGGTKADGAAAEPARRRCALRTLKKQKYVAVSVYMDFATNARVQDRARRQAGDQDDRQMPAGALRLNIPIPKSQIRKGVFRVTVRATTGVAEGRADVPRPVGPRQCPPCAHATTASSSDVSHRGRRTPSPTCRASSSDTPRTRPTTRA